MVHGSAKSQEDKETWTLYDQVNRKFKASGLSEDAELDFVVDTTRLIVSRLLESDDVPEPLRYSPSAPLG